MLYCMRTDGGLKIAVVAKNKFKIQNIVPDGLDRFPVVGHLVGPFRGARKVGLALARGQLPIRPTKAYKN
jgi:hypothetical protein